MKNSTQKTDLSIKHHLILAATTLMLLEFVCIIVLDVRLTKTYNVSASHDEHEAVKRNYRTNRHILYDIPFTLHFFFLLRMKYFLFYPLSVAIYNVQGSNPQRFSTTSLEYGQECPFERKLSGNNSERLNVDHNAYHVWIVQRK